MAVSSVTPILSVPMRMVTMSKYLVNGTPICIYKLEYVVLGTPVQDYEREIPLIEYIMRFPFGNSFLLFPPNLSF